MDINNADILKAIEHIAIMTELDKKTLTERALKLSEENGELSQAVLSYTNADGCGYKNLGVKDVINECVDVTIVALSIMFQCGGNLEEFVKVFDTKMVKWHKNITKKDLCKVNEEKM